MDTVNALRLRRRYYVDYIGPTRLSEEFDISINHVYRVVNRIGIYKDVPDLITDEEYQMYYMNKAIKGYKLYS